MTRHRLVLTGLTVALGASALPGLAHAQAPTALPQGTASGDVRATSALIWSRAPEQARMQVRYGTRADLSSARTVRATRRVTPASDFTGQVRLRDLRPATTYHYAVRFLPTDGSPSVESETGSFTTAPARDTSAPVSFIVAGDLQGQRYCRRQGRGYDIFARMEALESDFVINNGDLIYADGDCPEDGPDGPGGWQNIPGDFPNIGDPSVDWTDTPRVREIYDQHWRYARADEHQRSFLKSTPMYAQWDDHEVINDFGAQWTYQYPSNRDRPGFPNLVREGRQSFFDWNPMTRDRVEENRIYRSFSWGEDADLFLLDARSYRDRNDQPDTGPQPKSLLGRTQLDWLKDELRGSQATWKVISNDVPISILTGSLANGRDGIAGGDTDQGFEREFSELLRFLDEEDIDNVVFVVCDVHNAQNIRYAVDADGDGDRVAFHEFVSGPLSAVAVGVGALDQTYSPVRPYGEGNLFNFGYVRIAEAADGQVHLRYDVRGEDGAVRPGSQVDLEPR